MKKISILIFCIFSFLIYHKFVFKEKSPKIILNGSNIVTINLNENYKEYGFKAYDSKGKNITDSVIISGQVDNQKEGTYELTYQVNLTENEIVKTSRFVKVKNYTYKDSYDNIDNEMHGWWSGNKKDGTRPSGGADINELKKYNAYFLGKNKKILYLTFDEGSNDTYVKEIVDVLNKNKVKATFFLCRKYILNNKELINKMVKYGHTVANHTANHLSMPSLATKENFSKYLEEIKSVEEAYYEVTGLEMEKIYRDPRGEWSYRDLQIMKDLGYKSYFYSADYLDFKNDVTKEYALNELTIRVHNGAIYLMHPKNKGNYLALDTFIKDMKKQGYTFDLVKNI